MSVQKTIYKIIRHIFFIAVSVIIFFMAGELICRLKYHPGSSIFKFDQDKIYALKANIKNGNYAGKPVETNSSGYRDSELQIMKDKNTLRILAVGDSVTFGHGVLAQENYAECLERRLNKDMDFARFDVINTAVPGNSPFQEYYDLKRGLVFRPDIVIIQFVLNDIVEPFKTFKRYGGKGIDYHNIHETCQWHNFLSEKSAFYLFLVDVSKRMKYKSIHKDELLRKAVQEEVSLSWNMGAEDPREDVARQQIWGECFKWLQKEVDLCKLNGIGCILLITPVDFQMFDETKTYTQNALKEFAFKNGIEFVDLLVSLREIARQKVIEKYNLSNQVQFQDITQTYRKELAQIWNYYFFDHLHLSSHGHMLTSDLLYPAIVTILKARNLVVQKSYTNG